MKDVRLNNGVMMPAIGFGVSRFLKTKRNGS